MTAVVFGALNQFLLTLEFLPHDTLSEGIRNKYMKVKINVEANVNVKVKDASYDRSSVSS